MADSKPQLTLEHLEFIKKGVAFIQNEESSVYEDAGKVPYNRIFAICDDDFNWSYLYECSLKETSVLMFAAAGLFPSLQKRLDQGMEINQAIMDVAKESDKLSDVIFEEAFSDCSEQPSIEELKAIRFGYGSM